MIWKTAILSVLCAAVAFAADAPEGRILCAYWREIPGTRVEDLTTLPAYPNHPNEQVYLNQFAIPEDQEGNFGTVIRGYVHPPEDGPYTFAVTGNNQCELWLGTDANPESKRLIASVPQWAMPQEWNAAPEQQSAPIELKRGARYYLEARHKNGGGDNHLAVAWKLPDGTFQGPIPGKYLSAAAPVAVLPPVVSLPPLPSSPGRHRLRVQVQYLTQQMEVPVLLTLPANYAAGKQQPAMVFLPDIDQEPAADGFHIQGPDKLQPADPVLQGICITPHVPAGRNYTQRTTIQALAAVVREVCKSYAVGAQRVGLTGETSGGTAVWALAAEMPGFYAAIAPVNGRDLRNPELARLLNGADIRIYTDISEGFATGCANRMGELLATVQPKPQVVYLGEKELGKGSAGEYCYRLPAFYAHVFRTDLAAQTPPQRNAWMLWAGIAAAVAAGGWVYLRRKQAV